MSKIPKNNAANFKFWLPGPGLAQWGTVLESAGGLLPRRLPSESESESMARPGPGLVLGGELSLLARQVPVTRSQAAITVTKHPGRYAVAHSQ